MDKICDKLKAYQPSMFKSRQKKIQTLEYDCPPEVNLSELTHCKEYTWKKHKVTFYYTTEDTDKLFKHVDRFIWLLDPSEPLVADILLTSAKKFYPPDGIFGPSHVNTGYSSDKIVVYRKEEWFKVFIHECFHFYHYEKVLFDPSFTPRILELFKVQSNVNLYESYCEVWARTLNCCMVSVCDKIPLSTLLHHEKKYSVRHMVNVLHHMNLTYDQLTEPNHFKEKTNVLAYVVLTAILMFHDFIPKHLSSMKNFTLKNALPYIQFIEQNHNNQHFLDLIHHTEPMITTTMSFYKLS
jgi:hypothetical protein